MRRLAIVFAILVAVSCIEQLVLSFSSLGARTIQRRRNIRRPWMGISEWRAFLIGPLRLFQRTAASAGAILRLGRTN